MRKQKVIVERIINTILKDIKTYKMALACIMIYTVAVKIIFHAFCPLLITFGIPCPGCGMTRAVYYLLTFRFKRSFILNPTAPMWVAAILYVAYSRYISGKYVKKRVTFILTVACIITVAVYLYRMLFFFPSYPPLVYNKNSIFFSIFTRYREIINKK